MSTIIYVPRHGAYLDKEDLTSDLKAGVKFLMYLKSLERVAKMAINLSPVWGSLGSFLCVVNVFAADIAGTIKYDGEVPKLPPLKMDADPACASKHTTPPMAEMLVLGSGNTMGNIFVHVKSGLPAKEYPAPKETVVINQEGCIYKPHVLGVMAGQSVKFKNADGVLHNVHALPNANQSFNMAMPATMVDSPEKNFAKVETDPFKIKCDVHPWMLSWVRVMPHPYFSVTKEDGKFSLSGLPAGTYEIEAWHEKLGVQTQSVTIADNDKKSVDFVFKKG